MVKLSIILPVNNEEAGIGSVIEELIKSFKKKKATFEIICVENGSTDRSYQKLKELSREQREIKVYQSKKGWGNAVRRGIEYAKGEYCCYMVSDNQVDPILVLTVFEKIRESNVDMVKIKRVSRENLIRLLNSRIYNLICNIFLGLGNDINGTPKILKTSLIKDLHLRSENVAIDLELMLKLKKRNLIWIDIPVNSKKRNWGKSTTNIKTVIEMLKYIIKFRLGKINH